MQDFETQKRTGSVFSRVAYLEAGFTETQVDVLEKHFVPKYF